MQIEVLSHEKGELNLQIDNQTVAEILRVYLNENGADFAAWKKEHPSKPIIMKIKAGNVMKTITDSVAAIKKDCNALVNEIKK